MNEKAGDGDGNERVNAHEIESLSQRKKADECDVEDDAENAWTPATVVAFAEGGVKKGSGAKDAEGNCKLDEDNAAVEAEMVAPKCQRKLMVPVEGSTEELHRDVRFIDVDRHKGATKHRGEGEHREASRKRIGGQRTMSCDVNGSEQRDEGLDDPAGDGNLR